MDWAATTEITWKLITRFVIVLDSRQCMSMRRKCLKFITSSVCAYCEWVDFSLKYFLLSMCLKLVSMGFLCCGFEKVVSQKQTNNYKFPLDIFRGFVRSACPFCGVIIWWRQVKFFFKSQLKIQKPVWKLNVVFYQCKGFSFDKEWK